MNTFIVSDASTAANATKDAVIGAGTTKALTTVAGAALPIPIVGGIVVDSADRLLRHFRKPRPIRGFEVYFLQGLSATATVQQQDGFAVFIPSSALAAYGQTPVVELLLLQSSQKDTARIVRSRHVAMKHTNSDINPTAVEVLGVEQNEIPCRKETRDNGDVVLTPVSPLLAGQYALVTIGTVNAGTAALSETVGAWDFRLQ